MATSTATSKSPRPQIGLLESTPKQVLPIGVRAIGRSGVLELMRIGGGLSYKEVGKRAGMPPVKAMRLIRGQYLKARHRDLRRILDVLWAALPAIQQPGPLQVIEEAERRFALPRTARPMYLTLDEAADLLKVNRAKMRRLASDRPELHAIRVGWGVRIPRQAIEEYILAPRRAAASSKFMSPAAVAALFRVHEDVIGYAIRTGRIRAQQSTKQKWGRWRIPMAEVRRIARFGVTNLPRLKSWGPTHRDHDRRPTA